MAIHLMSINQVKMNGSILVNLIVKKKGVKNSLDINWLNFN